MNQSNRGLLIAIIVLLAGLLLVTSVLVFVLLRQEPQEPQATQSMQVTTTAAVTEEETSPVTEPVSEGALVPAEAESPFPGIPDTNSRAVYRDILQAIHDTGEYDGFTFEKLNPEDKDVGRFAVFDVDSDGKEELIVLWDDTFMAGMIGIIYGTDDAGNVITEYSGFPAQTFYSNGIIEEGISHNQGLAGEFWPYSISRYNAGTDTYDNIGFVDAWDSSLSETDYEGASFPAYADTSGKGVVYYINAPDYEKNGQPVDITEYEAWHKTLLDGSVELLPDFRQMTNQNIQDITAQ